MLSAALHREYRCTGLFIIIYVTFSCEYLFMDQWACFPPTAMALCEPSAMNLFGKKVMIYVGFWYHIGWRENAIFDVCVMTHVCMLAAAIKSPLDAWSKLLLRA